MAQSPYHGAMRVTIASFLLLLLVACGASHVTDSHQEMLGRLERRLGPHWSVLHGADAMSVSLVATDAMARASHRAPASLEGFLGWQQVKRAGPSLPASVMADLRRILTDPDSFDLTAVVQVLPAPCPLMLVVRSGEDARAVGIDLQHRVLTVSAGNRFQKTARFQISKTGLLALKFLADLLPSKPR